MMKTEPPDRGERAILNHWRAELALKYEPLIREKAKERQATSTGGNKPQLIQNSVQAEPIKTQKELSKIADVSHDTLLQNSVKRLA